MSAGQYLQTSPPYCHCQSDGWLDDLHLNQLVSTLQKYSLQSMSIPSLGWHVLFHIKILIRKCSQHARTWLFHTKFCLFQPFPRSFLNLVLLIAKKRKTNLWNNVACTVGYIKNGFIQVSMQYPVQVPLSYPLIWGLPQALVSNCPVLFFFKINMVTKFFFQIQEGFLFHEFYPNQLNTSWLKYLSFSAMLWSLWCSWAHGYLYTMNLTKREPFFYLLI